MPTRLQLYIGLFTVFLAAKLILGYLWGGAPVVQHGWVRESENLRMAESKARAAAERLGHPPTEDEPLAEWVRAAGSDSASSTPTNESRDIWGNPYRCAQLTEGETSRLGVYSTGEDGLSRSHGSDPDDLNSWSYNGRSYYRKQDRTRELHRMAANLALSSLYCVLLSVLATELFLAVARANRRKAEPF